MPQIKIPDSLKKFFRKEGIDDLPRILELLATVSPVIVINTQDFPVQTFPGGKLRLLTIDATAGDVNKYLSPGSGKIWILLWGRITLVADATVADRYINLSFTDGTSITFLLGYNTNAITASETKTVQLGRGSLGTDVTGVHAEIALPEKPIIKDADQLQILITGGVAGDSYSGYVTVLEIDA